MTIYNNREAFSAYLSTLKNDQRIGFVPTMGALHNGHLSLLKEAQKSSDIVICSIFVNPTQFNVSSDYDAYPQVLEQDVEKLSTVNVDALFAPSVADLYPTGTEHIPHYDIGMLDHVLEGEHRPGHFQGVCHIIDVFLKLIDPHRIFMGEKDFQQIAVVCRLIELKQFKTKLIACPTLREKSGLAMSSRNSRLSQHGLIQATTLFKALEHIRIEQDHKSFNELKNEAEEMLRQNGFTPEYIALCNADTLIETSAFDSDRKQRLIAAAFLEGVRLIDNIAV